MWPGSAWLAVCVPTRPRSPHPVRGVRWDLQRVGLEGRFQACTPGARQERRLHGGEHDVDQGKRGRDDTARECIVACAHKDARQMRTDASADEERRAADG